MSACTAILAVLGMLVSPSFTDDGKELIANERLLECPTFVEASETGVITASAGKDQSLFIIGESTDAGDRAIVRAVIPATSADLVLLNAGYNNNIRPGMVCVVEQQGKAIASLVIAESTAERAIGPILTLAPEASIQPGNIARIKTVLFN